MSNWRQRFKVHPSADTFPMMSAEELDKLGADIKAHGLKEPITFNTENVLLDGRNRLEAGERAGVPVGDQHHLHTFEGDDAAQVAFIISKNIHRRHLKKQELGDHIVAAIKAAEKKLDQVKPVSKGGRGKVNETKARAVAEAKKLGISESTIKLSLTKAEGRAKPKAKSSNRPKWAQGDDTLDATSEPEPVSSPAICGDLTMARKLYLQRCEASPRLDLGAEVKRITKALRRMHNAKAHPNGGSRESDPPSPPETERTPL